MAFLSIVYKKTYAKNVMSFGIILSSISANMTINASKNFRQSLKILENNKHEYIH